MFLELSSRLCGTVYVIECKGRIVAGKEVEALEAALNDETRRHLNHVVLHVSEVTRLDSTGLGLLVRVAVLLQKRGGDLRLATPSDFITNLLDLTRVSTILKTFPTEEQAILSFYQQQTQQPLPGAPHGRVLVIDRSADFCAFVRTVLTQHGYSATSASLANDARILLAACKVDYILLGPGAPQIASGSVAHSLKSLCPQAQVFQLDEAFKALDAHESSAILLQLLRPGDATSPS